VSHESFNNSPAAATRQYPKAGARPDGKPLPTYEQLGLDRQLCWIAVAKQIVAEMARALKVSS
jgi:hypothetical protein